MKEELEKYNNWLLTNKNIDLSEYFTEYVKVYIKPKITIKELIEYLGILHGVSYYDLVTHKYLKSRGGSNTVALARGQLVKYVADNKIEGWTQKETFIRLFGFYRSHSVVNYWQKQEYTGALESKYKTLCKFIENHEILWTT